MRRCCPIRGFSLTELLVVVAVILVLVSILIIGTEAVYSRAMRLKCTHRMEQVWQACLMYASASHGRFPAAWDYDRGMAWYDTLVATGHLNDATVTQCPLSEVVTSATVGGYSPGVPTETSEAITKALDWFKANQRADGGWSAARAGGTQDQGATGLALLCFLGFGCTDTAPVKYKDTVRKAIDCLLSKQDSAGKFTTYYHDYTQGTCTMALCDAVAMGVERARPAAQRALDYLTDRQDNTTYGGFFESGDRLTSGGTQNDMSASSWCYQGLASARHAGLSPSRAGITWSSVDALSLAFFNTTIQIDIRVCANGHYTPAHQLVNGKCRTCGGSVSSAKSVYPDSYSTVYRFNPAGYNHSSQSRYRMTVSNFACRILHGHLPTSDHSPRTYGQGENSHNVLAYLTQRIYSDPEHIRFAKGGAVPDGTGGTSGYDLYTVYYLALGLYAVGGEEWDTFKEIYVPQVISRQNADGSYPVNYAPYGSSWGGPPYVTALGCIALEASVGELLVGTKWTTAGNYGYGYNKLVGEDRRRPAGDTIILLDYIRSAIDTGDPQSNLAPRHGGKVNVLLGDGRVEAIPPEDLVEQRDEGVKIKMRLLTPQVD